MLRSPRPWSLARSETPRWGFGYLRGYYWGWFKFLQDPLAPMALVYGIPPLVAVVLPMFTGACFSSVACRLMIIRSSIADHSVKDRRTNSYSAYPLTQPSIGNFQAASKQQPTTLNQKTSTVLDNQLIRLRGIGCRVCGRVAASTV